MNDLTNFFGYVFVQRAFFAGSFIAIACSVLGVFLVLRKMSFIGDGLSHVSFGSIAIGLFLGIYPLFVAIPLVMLASILIVKISQKARLYGDAAIAVVSSLGIAFGVLFASLSGGFTVDLFSYLFGSILAISASEVWISVILSLLVIGAVIALYWDLFLTTFDEEYALVNGVKVSGINIFLALLTGITVVLSVKVVGILLVSALLIFPAVSSLQISKTFSKTLVFSAVFSVLSVCLGIALSFLFDLPSGAVIVILLALCFFLAFLYKRMRNSV